MFWAVLLSVGNFFCFLKKYASPAWLLLPGFKRLLAEELERCSLLCVTGCLLLKWENRLVVFPLYLSLVGGSHKAHRTCNTTTSYSINRRWDALQYSTYMRNWEAYVRNAYFTEKRTHMYRISVPIALFGAYLAAVDELSILLKPKVFPYFAGSARKRRQLMFAKLLAGSHLPCFATCTIILLYTFLTILCV